MNWKILAQWDQGGFEFIEGVGEVAVILRGQKNTTGRIIEILDENESVTVIWPDEQIFEVEGVSLTNKIRDIWNSIVASYDNIPEIFYRNNSRTPIVIDLITDLGIVRLNPDYTIEEILKKYNLTSIVIEVNPERIAW